MSKKDQQTPKSPSAPQQTGTLQTAMQQNQYFSVKNIMDIFLLRWPWIILSVIICGAAAYFYLKTQTPIYSGTAKFLIKEDNTNSSARSRYGSVKAAENLGMITTSDGTQNELEIIKSTSVVESAVRNLKLNVEYSREGRFRSTPIYKYQPLTVALDSAETEKLLSPISLQIAKNGSSYAITGKYTIVYKDDRPNVPKEINTTIKQLPATVKTDVGTMTISVNTHGSTPLADGDVLNVRIAPLSSAASMYAAKLDVALSDKLSSIMNVSCSDAIPERIEDFLNELFRCYNDEANKDKNIIAERTEDFINDRLEKINAELGLTEGQLEDFKRRNDITDLRTDATNALASQKEYEKSATEMQTQIELLNNVSEYISRSQNHYQPLPVNIGIQDATTTQLMAKYNEMTLQRNHLLRTASEQSSAVIELTEQLNLLSSSIKQAIASAKKNLQTQYSSLQAQYAKYTSQIQQGPSHERTLTEIGRQQEVRSGLYLMLLNKREENSISLAATADKGKVIEKPIVFGPVAPKKPMILAVGIILGFAIPIGIFILLQFLKYKISGREDIKRYTSRPVIADIPVANNSVKTKADIVVHENSNTQIEEIFRGLRTSLQFILNENEKVIMFTSSMSGEGKTFVAGNLSMSFALLGKKVILVGLDIRKPRLAELFGIRDHRIGITNILCIDNPTAEDVQSQIMPSGVNDNLDLLMAGVIPPNPAELIARPSLEKIMGHLSSMYDYIIIDTAPVGLVTDTLQIGRVADTTVYVTRCDYTPKRCLEGFEELEEKLPSISLIINGVDMSKRENRFHYGYGRYGRYGHYGKYGSYGNYGNYTASGYGATNDKSIKTK